MIGQAASGGTHRWPNVQYVLSSTDFVRRDADGEVLFDSRSGNERPEASAALWAEPLPPHSVENVRPLAPRRSLFYRIAIALIGEPVPPTMRSGAATNRKSQRPSRSHSSRSSSNCK
jgi:hypothetical protein